MAATAYYHLPGLFEFQELYAIFLPLFKEHREYFYPWCEIGSIYGAPAAALWGGGRAGYGEEDAEALLNLMETYHIPARLTFSNSLLEEKHLQDKTCNALCARLSKGEGNGVILHSELLLHYLKEHYPNLELISSTTKVLTTFQAFKEELDRPEFQTVVPDFRLNKAFPELETLSAEEKKKVEFLVNECCWIDCQNRKRCYEEVSRKSLGEKSLGHYCSAPGREKGYRFSSAMKNPSFIGREEIQKTYLPMGFSQFKIEGRSLGSALVLEFLLYYMTKPEYQLQVREEIYLDSSLDLF